MTHEEIKNEILLRSDLIEIVSEYVRLTKRGRNFVGLCPFHNEKTPSFTISPDKQIYKCFGCGKSGNVITFLMEHNGLSYLESLKFLGDKYGVKFEYTQTNKDETLQIEEVYEVLAKATQYFQKFLYTKEGVVCKEYYETRGFTKRTIEEFKLGFAPNSFEQLSNYLKKEGFSEDTIKEAGLSVESETGKHYDRFRNRAIFPIQDIFGRIIAFGARQLENEKNQPKYINSPQTIVYDKSKVLYGIFQAKNNIINKQQSILVEGYADVITLHQYGFKNAIASSGTSLTEEQLKQLKRYSDNILILYDGDQAGINATERAIELALQQAFNVHSVILPNNNDPDIFLKENGANALSKILAEPLNFILFFFEKNKKSPDFLSPTKKSEIIQKIIYLINLIPDEIQQNFLMQELALKLDFNNMQIKSLYKIKENLKSGKITAKNELKQKSIQPSSAEKEFIFEQESINLIKKMSNAENSLIKISLQNDDAFNYFKSKNFYKELLISKISIKIIDFISQSNSLKDLFDALNQENVNPYIKSIISRIALMQETPSENWEKYFQSEQNTNKLEYYIAVKLHLQLDKIEREIKESRSILKTNISDIELTSTLEALNSLIQKREEIRSRLNKL
jgi:DNA primase